LVILLSSGLPHTDRGRNYFKVRSQEQELEWAPR
jgi:hypothetical protein